MNQDATNHAARGGAAAPDSHARDQGLNPVRTREILKRLGFHLTTETRILDLGCGAGGSVYALRDAGFVNAIGYDIKDYLKLRDPGDRSMFVIADPKAAGLPFDDDSFDLVISEQVMEHVMDQVGMLRELHRILRPGGYSLHAMPARYCPVEVHMLVPLGGFFAHRWWYKLWAVLGVRNRFQKGLSADEATDRNVFFFVGSLRYIPNSFYRVVWKRLGFEWTWTDQEHFDTSPRPAIRMLGRLNRFLPVLAWINQTFHGRRVCLKKPAA
jgi:SAM-dependent methyltransferase